ncbi:MAG: cyclic nucleotide-binding domain-containing protein [bacterium]|nr:cyclic nucleotide-binding domain-containing protein [bacterium]
MQMTSHAKRFLSILDKIPMFQKLTPGQAMEILRICKPKTLGDREIAMRHGTRSTEMYILLTGKLVVTAQDGTPLTYLSPITTVGEMGVVTGQPRTATVVAENQASVFEISKIKFEVVLKKYPDIGFVIYRNIITILSQRLNSTNKQLVNCQQELNNLKQTGALST